MTIRTAIVMSSTGSSYLLRDVADGTLHEAGIRGRLRLKGVRSTNPVAVGDRVGYEAEGLERAVIVSVCPRSNYVIRRSPNLSKESHIIAANLDRALVVVTLFSPETNTEFIDRFLVTCEAYNVPASIVLNKYDMASKVPGAVEEFTDLYAGAGYEVISVSASEGYNIQRIREITAGATTLLSGNSGVGKSTLIGALVPDAEVRTGDISDYHRKGRHTTTYSQMYELPYGGYLIDTPGIKGFGLIEIEPAGLYRYFPEMMECSRECRFYNCTHVHEPGCAVRRTVEEGAIAESRYISYLKILEEDDKYRK